MEITLSFTKSENDLAHFIHEFLDKELLLKTYDYRKYEEVLFSENLKENLAKVYSQNGECAIAFLSENYFNVSEYTKIEWETILERHNDPTNQFFILPIINSIDPSSLRRNHNLSSLVCHSYQKGEETQLKKLLLNKLKEKLPGFFLTDVEKIKHLDSSNFSIALKRINRLFQKESVSTHLFWGAAVYHMSLYFLVAAKKNVNQIFCQNSILLLNKLIKFFPENPSYYYYLSFALLMDQCFGTSNHNDRIQDLHLEGKNLCENPEQKLAFISLDDQYINVTDHHKIILRSFPSNEY